MADAASPRLTKAGLTKAGLTKAGLAKAGLATAGPKVVVYACTHLDYDQIFSPVAPTPGVDFLLFADRRPRLVRGWRGGRCPRRSRACRRRSPTAMPSSSPTRCCPRPSCSIYLDANTLVLGDLTPLIAEFLASGADIGLFRAPRALEPRRGVRVRPAGREDPARRRREGPAPSSAATARPGCPPTRPSPRTRSSSAATAARRSPRRWRSGGRSSRTTPSATS